MSSSASALPRASKKQSLKVAFLRPKFDNLREWVEASKRHVMVTRHGRVFVTDKKNKQKSVYSYPTSKWANPFVVGKKDDQYTLQRSLELYVKHLRNEGMDKQFDELQGKCLGCFCDTNKCHAYILSKLVNGDVDFDGALEWVKNL